jgi:hypothetical protein
MAAVSAVFSVISGVVGAIGAIASANAQAAAAEYNAKVQERNSVIAEQDRQTDVHTARLAAEDTQRNNRRVLASMRAAYGTSGFEMAGSPLDVLEDTAIEQAMDVRRIESEGYSRSREGSIKSMGLREDANLKRMEGKAAKTAGYIGAAGAFFSGVGQGLARLN